MRSRKLLNPFVLVLLTIALFASSSCVSSKKLDKYVSEQFNDQLPKADAKKPSTITVKTSISGDDDISHSYRKTEKVLPFIVYLQSDYVRYTDLNPAIPISYFSQTVHANKTLNQKLNGRTLELTVEQIPSAFAYVIRTHAILLFVKWSSTYQRPQLKDMIVSYRVIDAGQIVKSGKVQVEDKQQKDYVFLQGWRTNTRESIDSHREKVGRMSKDFVNKMLTEL